MTHTARVHARARTGIRQERKERTRQALLDAALRVLEHESFSSMSLREVAREAGVVPTAFYRHFAGTEELGLALVDESFRTLREMIRGARSTMNTEHIIRSSAEILVHQVIEHRAHFRFIARERYSGVPALRHAIRTELRLFASELAVDLARFPNIRAWSTEDVQALADLMVNAMISIAESVLEAPPASPAAEQEVIKLAERQLRMIALGIPHWRSR